MYKTRLKDRRGVIVAFNAPSVLEAIRIALGFGAISYSIRLHNVIVYQVKV